MYCNSILAGLKQHDVGVYHRRQCFNTCWCPLTGWRTDANGLKMVGSHRPGLEINAYAP